MGLAKIIKTRSKINKLRFMFFNAHSLIIVVMFFFLRTPSKRFGLPLSHGHFSFQDRSRHVGVDVTIFLSL